MATPHRAEAKRPAPRLYLVTPAKVSVARPLVEGLRIPTVALDDRIWELVNVRPTTFDEAVGAALEERRS